MQAAYKVIAMIAVTLCVAVGAASTAPAYAQSPGEIPSEGITLQKNATHVTVDWRDAEHATKYLIQIYAGVNLVDGLFVPDSILVDKELSPNVRYTITAIPYRDFVAGVEKTLVMALVEGVPKPDPQPDPQPEPEPDPQPEPQPQPDPQPEPEPDPQPEPQPQPDPQPEPEPDPQPEPQPQPPPEPDPQPQPQPLQPDPQLPAQLQPMNITVLVDAIANLAGVIEGLSLKIVALEEEVAGLQASNNAPYAPALADSGDFIPVYYSATSASNLAHKSFYENQLFLESFTGRLTQTLALPHDVYLTMDECDKPRAYYLPDYDKLVICYEIITYLERLLAPYSDTEEELARNVYGFVTWVTLHELGHALIDVYDLPVTGNEEDAVDQFATIIALEYIPPDQAAAILYPTLLTWSLVESSASFEDQLAGPHSLAKQRYYNIACWVYGSNVHGYSGLINDVTLPEERAIRCQFEYDRMSESWYRLVSPFLINPGSVPPP